VNTISLSGLISAATDDNDGHLIGTHVAGDGTVTNYEETVTAISFNTTTNQIEYIDENGDTQAVDLGDLVSTVSDDNANAETHDIATHVSGDGTTVVIQETVTDLTFDPAADELTYIDENGDVNTISLSGLISAATDDNDGHLIGTHVAGDGTVTNYEETVTAISFNTTTNQIEYIDENGDTQAVNLGDLVSTVSDDNANTNTHDIATHVSGDGTTTVVQETVTELTFDPSADELTYIDENGTPNTVSLSGLISAATDDNNGHLIGTHVAGDGTVTNYEETVTAISFNTITNQIEYIDENGDTQAVNLGDLVSQVTDMNVGEHQIASHVSGDGTTTAINETVTSLSYDDANTRIIYIDEEGVSQNVDLSGLLSSANDLNDGHLIAQHVDANGNTTDIEETVTSLGFNSTTNRIEYTDENGVLNPVDLGDLVSDVTDSNDGHIIATHVSGDGTSTNIEETVTTLTYDDANTRIQYVDENGVTQNVDLNGLVSSGTDVNDGHLIGTHVDGNGNVTNYEETVTSISYSAANETITYTDENGIPQTLDLSGLSDVSAATDDNDGHLIGTHTANGVTTNFEETVTTLTYDDANTRIQYVDENGVTQNVDLNGLVSSGTDVNDGHLIGTHVDGNGNVTNYEETVTSISYSAANETITYTDENGVPQTLDLSGLSDVSAATDDNDGHLIGTHTANGVTTNFEETVTTLTYDDANTRIQYTDENGVLQNVDLTGLLSDANDLNNGHLIAQHVDANGNTTDIEETVTAIAYDNSTTTITYTDENGVDQDIDLSGLANASTATDDNDGHLIGTHTAGGVTTNFEETITGLTLWEAVMLRYTKEDGTVDEVNLSRFISEVTDLNDGKVIATHNDNNGNLVNIEETVTTFVDNGDGTYTYTSEDGTTTTTTTEKDCFYPPSVPIDASSTGVKTLDLHQEYIDQYGSPVISSPGAGAIPTFSEAQLDYHVLDYDSSTIQVHSISAQGVMSYEVLQVPKCNCSYINTLFCEK